jgi:hypothetical protein
MALLASDRISVSVIPDTLQLSPGTQGAVTLAVVNKGQLVDQFELRIAGEADRGWLSIREPSVALNPNEAGRLALDVNIPSGSDVRAGHYHLELSVVSRADPAVRTVADLDLEVLPAGGIELALRPQMATSRGTAHFNLNVSNTGNLEQSIDLTFADPAEALEGRLDTDRLVIQPGGNMSVPLEVRASERPWVAAPRRYDFEVQARPTPSHEEEAAEPSASAGGALIYRAPLAFLAGMPGGLAALLLALAILLLLAGLAIWFGVSHGSRTPTNPAEATPSPDMAATAAAQSDATNATAAAVAAAANAAATANANETATAESSATPTGVPPTILRFDLTVPPDAGRGEFDLHWQVDGASEVTIDGQTRDAAGTERVTRPTGGEFELDARGAGGEVKKTIGVVVLQKPAIHEFQASALQVAPGESVTLTWQLDRTDRAAVNDQMVDPNAGSLEVQPKDPESAYQLVAENELGRATQTITIHVGPSSGP